MLETFKWGYFKKRGVFSRFFKHKSIARVMPGMWRSMCFVLIGPHLTSNFRCKFFPVKLGFWAWNFWKAFRDCVNVETGKFHEKLCKFAVGIVGKRAKTRSETVPATCPYWRRDVPCCQVASVGLPLLSSMIMSNHLLLTRVQICWFSDISINKNGCFWASFCRSQSKRPLAHF